jgi:hypothetical protein
MEVPVTDQWTEKLRCPHCENVGIANRSQSNDTEIPTVDGVRWASKPFRLSMAQISIAGTAISRCCRKAASVGGVFHFCVYFLTSPITA